MDGSSGSRVRRPSGRCGRIVLFLRRVFYKLISKTYGKKWLFGVACSSLILCCLASKWKSRFFSVVAAVGFGLVAHNSSAGGRLLARKLHKRQVVPSPFSFFVLLTALIYLIDNSDVLRTDWDKEGPQGEGGSSRVDSAGTLSAGSWTSNANIWKWKRAAEKEEGNNTAAIGRVGNSGDEGASLLQESVSAVVFGGERVRDDGAALIEADAQKSPEALSVIIAARDEDAYIARTIFHLLENTPTRLLKEIIIVDDASEVPVSKVLAGSIFSSAYAPPWMENEKVSSHEKEGDKEGEIEKDTGRRRVKGSRSATVRVRELAAHVPVKVLRLEGAEGLIRARIAGANVAQGRNLFFLDGHCRVKVGWERGLLQELRKNYKRIACPIIQDIDAGTWDDLGTQGTKMMFGWNFEFDWYDDFAMEIPLSAGGILAITKKWWEESGEYDPGMLGWGGENLEQSMRVWMCGGEIVLSPQSFVGHIFDRPAKPNPGNSLIRQVQRNQKRAALVWLDDYYPLFEHFHPEAAVLDPGPGLESRMELRASMGCKGFQWYVDRFRNAFERKGMLLEHFHNVQHSRSGLCLSSVEETITTRKEKPAKDGQVKVLEQTEVKTTVALTACDSKVEAQRWQAVAGGRMLMNQANHLCLDRAGGDARSTPILFPCDWLGVFEEKNKQQLFLFAGERVFYPSKISYKTKNGNDRLYVPTTESRSPQSLCLASAADITPAAPVQAHYPVKMLNCASPKIHDLKWTWLW